MTRSEATNRQEGPHNKGPRGTGEEQGLENEGIGGLEKQALRNTTESAKGTRPQDPGTFSNGQSDVHNSPRVRLREFTADLHKGVLAQKLDAENARRKP